MHTVRVGAVELSAQDENRYGVPNLELLCQVLQLQPQVRPLPGLPVDKAEYERTWCRWWYFKIFPTTARAQRSKAPDPSRKHAHETDTTERGLPNGRGRDRYNH